MLDDSVNDIKQVNHLKIFMDKMYTIFHKSNKNQAELFNISQELGQQMLKIGKVLGHRWQSWAPQNLHSFRNRKYRKTARGVPQPQSRKFAVTFRTSATANVHGTSANLDCNIYCYFVLVIIFFLEVKILLSPRR